MGVQPNALFYGDNLDVLPKYFDSESVDLVYLDPPFNSKESYNVLFKEVSGVESEAQLQAFTDFWHWDDATERLYLKVQERADKVSDALVEIVKLLSRNDMSAYLVRMTASLVELHRVLKRNGSLYLHCDPTASHYLKIILDVVFNPRNFRNEVIWKRTFAHSGADKMGPVHDTILFYTKSDEYVWHPKKVEYSDTYKKNFFKFTDPKTKKPYRLTLLTGSGTRGGSSGKPWRGVNPTKIGRHWAIPGYVRPLLGSVPLPDVQSALDKLDEIGRVFWPQKKGGMPLFIQYQDDLGGVELQDVWADIPPIPPQSPERTGYQTQKPIALLDRIIDASSDEGQVILDPFCGCGTAIISANGLKRKWFGIDITHLAITLIKSRLKEMKVYAGRDYQIVGEPKAFTDAEALAKLSKFQFEWWALSLLDASPSKPSAENPRIGTKGAEGGVDGWLTFREGTSPELEKVLIQVKGGENIGVHMVRDLKGAMDAKRAKLGVLITLYEPTEPMMQTAREYDYYESPTWGQKYPRAQIITIQELLSGKKPNLPQTAGRA